MRNTSLQISSGYRPGLLACGIPFYPFSLFHDERGARGTREGGGETNRQRSVSVNFLSAFISQFNEFLVILSRRRDPLFFLFFLAADRKYFPLTFANSRERNRVPCANTYHGGARPRDTFVPLATCRDRDCPPLSSPAATYSRRTRAFSHRTRLSF